MFRAIFISLMILLLCSCSEHDRALESVERTMIEQPERALDALSVMDTLSITESQKARRALLQAYVATVWRIPVDMSPLDISRATTAFDGMCTTDEVKSLIIKSEFARAGGNPVLRLELLKDAEFLASQLGDNQDLAFIYLYLAQVYTNGFNGVVSQYYANKSLRLFNESGCIKQSIDARMAIVGALCAKRDYAGMLDSLLSMRPDVLAYSTDSYKTYFFDQLARSLDENGRADEAIEIWHSIYDIDSITSNTLAHWARTYIHAGSLDSAELLIDKAIALPHNTTDEYLCRNVQYEILQRLGRKSELPLIDSLRNKAANLDYSERKIAESSLALNEKYESVTRSAWRDIEAAKKRTTVLFFVFVIIFLLMMGGILFFRKRNQLLKVENENNLLKLQSLEHNLFENAQKQSDVSKKVAALFKSRFSTIDRLASAYFECKETGQEQKRIFGEVKSVIDAFVTPDSIHELEEIVNASNDNLMANFDGDFPKMSVSQRRLALLIFCGLSLQSISIFQGTDLRNIYVYKSRLKSVISRSDSPRKDLYLSYFS